jgi:hypothetical protein
MFPLSIGTYVKIGIAFIVISGSWYSGYRFESSRFEAYKLEQEKAVKEAEDKHQAATDAIRKEKDDQINAINNQLADALVQLRKRPSRSQGSSNGQVTAGSTGATLFAEDAEFLIREASRADQIRVALDACYKQYDAVSK